MESATKMIVFLHFTLLFISLTSSSSSSSSSSSHSSSYASASGQRVLSPHSLPFSHQLQAYTVLNLTSNNSTSSSNATATGTKDGNFNLNNNNNNNNNNYNNTTILLPDEWLEGQGVEAPSWPSYLPIYVTIMNVVVFFTGTLGNVLVIIVVVAVRDMRTPMNWYLVNLSLADLLVLLVCQPAALVEFFARERWILGEVLCKLVPFLEHASSHASTMIIMCITVERYYAICKPLRTTSFCHKPHPLRVLPGVWATAILSSVPFSVITSLDDSRFFDGTPCKVCATSLNEHWHFAFIIGTSVAFFGLPLLLLIFFYVRIIHSLRSSGAEVRVGRVEDVSARATRRSRKQVVKMLIGIVILFFVCLMPVRCIIIWQIFVSDQEVQGLGPERYYNLMWISRLLMYVNSAGNPIIYSLMSSRFQEAFFRLLTGRRRDHTNARGSVSSRTSVSRYSLSGVNRHSLSPNNNSMCNGHSDRKAMLILRKIRTNSMSSWTAIQDSPTSSPSVQNEEFLPPKQRSCTSIL